MLCISGTVARPQIDIHRSGTFTYTIYIYIPYIYIYPCFSVCSVVSFLCRVPWVVKWGHQEGAACISTVPKKYTIIKGVVIIFKIMAKIGCTENVTAMGTFRPASNYIGKHTCKLKTLLPLTIIHLILINNLQFFEGVTFIE